MVETRERKGGVMVERKIQSEPKREIESGGLGLGLIRVGVAGLLCRLRFN